MNLHYSTAWELLVTGLEISNHGQLTRTTESLEREDRLRKSVETTQVSSFSLGQGSKLRSPSPIALVKLQETMGRGSRVV
ncbi:hypothetical protein TNCV_4579841 [Trichonephila clavipes]|nr:hypothetical protein TNCV_4579841 [Trichonephila clavipes]